MGDKKSRGAGDFLVSLWPAMPFMGFGFISAWLALAHGTAWLSPMESTGRALTNFLIVVYVSMGAVIISAGVGPAAWRRFLSSTSTAQVAGAVASLGSLAIILIGPAYLQQMLGSASYAVFQVSSVFIGLSLGVMYLCLGALYGRLPLRRAILYFCYASLLAVFVYLAVQVSPVWSLAQNSPPAIFIVVFVALPGLAGLMFRLDPNGNPWTARAQDDGASSFRELGGLRRPLACFAFALLLFSFAQSALSTAVTNSIAPTYTLASSNLVVLVRVPILLAFALIASLLEARRLDFGRLLVGLVSLLEVVVLIGLVFDISGAAWLVPVRAVVFCFQVLTWCMVFAVANCHLGRATTSVAICYGSFALGTGLGSLVGVEVFDACGSFVLLAVCALALVPCFLLLDVRNTEGLFAGGQDSGASLEALLGKTLEGLPVREKGDFRRKLDEYAASKGLSAREAQTLGYLVAGRGDSQIAEAMGISYNTARTRVRNVYNKLDVHDRQTLIDVINGELRS